MRTAAMAMLMGCALSTCGWAAEEGLVAWYTFEGAAGGVVKNVADAGNDGKLVGGAHCTQTAQGWALDLDGAGGYLDCGAGAKLDIGRAGALAIWCTPRTRQGGIINWSTGGGWTDERLVLAINTYHGGASLLGCFADGKSFQQFAGLGEVKLDEWTHFAVAFDGRSVQIYKDGLLHMSVSQAVKPDISGVPLWLGRCQGLGEEYFDGLLDEARVYNRALSAREVLALYKQDAAGRGKDMTVFRQVQMDVAAHSGPGRIVAALDARGMHPLPAGARLEVTARRTDAGAEPLEATVAPIPDSAPAEVIFDLQEAPPGEYEIAARILEPGDQLIGEESRAKVLWEGQPEAFRGVRILNNLVWELLNVTADAAEEGPGARHVFNNPTQRWILVRATAQVPQGGSLGVELRTQDGADKLIEHTQAGQSTLEAMRFLGAGEHALQVRATGGATLEQLVVRSIPMIQHAFYGANPHIAPYGPYDWEFLTKDVLPNVNVMIGGPGPELEAWKASGLKWIGIVGLPKVAADDPEAVDKTYLHWSGATGLKHPLLDGIIIDEFGGGDQPIYDVYRKATERIYAQPQFAGKAVMPYGGTFYGQDRSSEFARAAFEGGGYMCWERYLPEQPDEEGAAGLIRRTITDEMARWEACFPDAAGKMCLVLGYMSQPTESLNIDPGVDYKVFMDMQFRALATHPLLFGLGGVQEYHSSYCDEENVRWAGRLYRHYCIEGNTQPLTRDPYRLPHLVNPDFAQALESWSVRAAREDSIRPITSTGYGWLQGRYPRTNRGDTCIVMRRSADKPNTVSQQIKALTPGRLYSLKAITADYQDLVTETSRKAQNAVRISIEGVELLQGPKQSFQFTFPNCYAHILGKFNAKYPYYMNYHWQVFRAKNETARLTVSDWADDQGPGGPIGQQTMLNFIEVQPYIGD